MKSEDQLAKNWFIFNIFNSFGVIDFICFGFATFVFILDIYISRKKLVLINLNAIFSEKIWCNFSYKNLF